MANTTIVYFDGIWKHDNTTRILRVITPRRDTLWVRSFENGVATISPTCTSKIIHVAEIIEGCFSEESNFKSELLKAFEYNEKTAFTSIKLKFSKVTIMVTKKNFHKEKIYTQWQAEMKANAERQRLEMEAYMKTPEYRIKRAKDLKNIIRRENVKRDVITVDETTKLQFKNKEAEKKWKYLLEINSKDDINKEIVAYARRYAKYMQHLMKKHNKTVFEIADNASLVSDIDCVSEYAHAYAVNMLIQCWKYGEELRKWYNNEA